jgi:hypothetical protein
MAGHILEAQRNIGQGEFLVGLEPDVHGKEKVYGSIP